MSVYREVELRCDGNGGPFDCDRIYYAKRAVQARREAREDGWLTSQPGGKDYCPEHRGTEGSRTDG